MKKSELKHIIHQILKEEIVLPIEIGDTILVGRFKNKKMVVKTIGKDEKGQPTINGKKLLAVRIPKLMNEIHKLNEGITEKIAIEFLSDMVKKSPFKGKDKEK